MHKSIILSTIFAVTVLFALYCVLLFRVGQSVYLDTKSPSQGILVLGAKSYKNTKFNPCLVERVRHGVNLSHDGYGDTFIFSGGNDKEDGKNEAETMSAIARDMGIQEEHILLEKNSTSTYENLANSFHVLQVKHINNVVLVTEPFHILRVSLVAKKLGMNFSVSPTQTSECWNRWKFLSRFFLREPFAIMYYFLKGRI